MESVAPKSCVFTADGDAVIALNELFGKFSLQRLANWRQYIPRSNSPGAGQKPDTEFF